jgi:hypothetical protein
MIAESNPFESAGNFIMESLQVYREHTYMTPHSRRAGRCPAKLCLAYPSIFPRKAENQPAMSRIIYSRGIIGTASCTGSKCAALLCGQVRDAGPVQDSVSAPTWLRLNVILRARYLLLPRCGLLSVILNEPTNNWTWSCRFLQLEQSGLYDSRQWPQVKL